jgi:hypothetical protein
LLPNTPSLASRFNWRPPADGIQLLLADGHALAFSDAIRPSQQTWQREACQPLNRTIHVYGFVLMGALLFALPAPALANCQSNDGQRPL